MSETAITHAPGPRQTVDRAIHPTLGEGAAVYDNGPAYFKADSGEVVPCQSISWGGWSKGPPERSWLTAKTEDGNRVELEALGLPKGDRHTRAWNAMHGAGWLVSLHTRPVEKARAMRFEPDGKPFEFLANGWARGRPATVAERERKLARSKTGSIKTGPRDPEDDRWVTYPLVSGETIAFRDEPPPPAPPAQATAASAQMSMFTQEAR